MKPRIVKCSVQGNEFSARLDLAGGKEVQIFLEGEHPKPGDVLRSYEVSEIRLFWARVMVEYDEMKEKAEAFFE